MGEIWVITTGNFWVIAGCSFALGCAFMWTAFTIAVEIAWRKKQHKNNV